MDYLLPGLLKKTITFRRLPAKNVVGYKIWASYQDDSYESGIRTELLDEIQNPNVPETYVKRIELKYCTNATWKLPHDAYLDRDHQFRLYLNGFQLSSMAYAFNRVTKLITLDTVMKHYDVNSKLEIEYYQDLIRKDYMVEEDCSIKVQPVFTESYTYGFHNVII